MLARPVRPTNPAHPMFYQIDRKATALEAEVEKLREGLELSRRKQIAGSKAPGWS